MQCYRPGDLLGTWLSFNSAPELAPLTLTKGDLLHQTGLKSALLPTYHLKTSSNMINHLYEGHPAAAANDVTLLIPGLLQVLGRLSHALL